MPKVTQHKFRAADRILNYKKIDACSFEVVRLKSDLTLATSDFCNFIHLPHNKPSMVVGAVNMRTSELDIDPFFLKSIDGKVRFFSFRVLVSYWSAFYLREQNKLEPDVRLTDLNRRTLKESFEKWQAQKFVFIEYAPEQLRSGPIKDTISVGDIGYLKDASNAFTNCILSASGYSIITENELTTPFQMVRDPIGYRAENGLITSFPSYSRPCLICDSNGYLRITTFDASEMGISLFDDEVILEDGSLGASEYRLFTAAYESAKTPVDSVAIELVVVETKVVAIQYGGGTRIPYSGLVISAPRSFFPTDLEARLDACNSVKLMHADGLAVKNGLQCGPSLVRNNRKVYSALLFEEEDFSQNHRSKASVPSTLYLSAGNTRAARTAIGITPANTLVGLVVEGTASSVSAETPQESYGATFDELADISIDLGLVDAIALDSGGSVGMCESGNSLVASGDVRWGSGVRKDRPLAHGMVFK